MSLGFLCVVLGVALLVRNQMVYSFHRKLFDHVFSRCKWWEAWAIAGAVSYDQMVWQLWRPLTIKEWYGDALDMDGDDCGHSEVPS